MDDILKDERFKHISTDKRFKILPKNERKFKVDNRFKKMFSDKKFKLKYSVDKRGRPLNQTTNENLKKFYDLSSENESEEERNEKIKEKRTEQIQNGRKSELKNETESDETDEEEKTDSEEESSEEDEKDDEKTESESESSTEDDSSDDDEESAEKNEQIEIPWNEFDRDTKREEKIFARLAVCNMDWDRIKATDLFVLLNSFKPADGIIKSIKIYLSDFGKERMEYEKMHGPAELASKSSSTSIKATNKSMNETENHSDSESEGSDESEDNYSEDENKEEGSDFNQIKLRQYQFNRLRYYYAIVECDSSETANKIYSECDGMEYESSCTRLDLRFVPDDTIFDESLVRDACLQTPDPLTYKPNIFFTTALNQTKVECTWDETPRDRLAITMKKYTEDDLKNASFNEILASSSSEEESQDESQDEKEAEELKKKKKQEQKEKEKKSAKKGNKSTNKNDEEERIKKFRELLLGNESKKNKKRDVDLEFAWEGGMKEEGFDDALFDADDTKPVSRSSKKNKAKYQPTEEEEKEKAQLSLLTIDNDEKNHFNLDDLLIDQTKTKKAKRKYKPGDKEEADDFKLNVDDPRFQAIFTDHRFNIDPSDQSFRKTKAMENLLDAKIKRKFEENTNKSQSNANNTASSNALHIQSNDALIKSIKNKTRAFIDKKDSNKNNNKKFKIGS